MDAPAYFDRVVRFADIGMIALEYIQCTGLHIMKRNGLSIFHHHVRDFARSGGISFEEALAKTKAMGFDGLATDLGLLIDDDSLRHLLVDNGMRIMTIFARIDFVHDDLADCKLKTEKLLDAAKAFGVGNVLVLPGLLGEGDDKDAGLDLICEGLSSACRMAAPMGIDVTIEDFGLPGAPNGTIAGCAMILDRVPGLRFTFDTGNFSCFGESPHDAYEVFRDRISFVHLKDHALGPNGLDTSMEVPVGDGALDLGRLVRRILDDGYAGDFAAEHFGHPDQETAMRRSASFCRQILDY